MHLLAYNTRFLILPWVQVPHSGVAHSGAHGEDRSRRLAAALRASDLLVGDVRGHLALRGHVLSRGQLAGDRHDGRDAVIARRPWEQTRPVKKMLGLPLHRRFREILQPMKRPRVDVNLEELDQIIERGTHAPLSEPESEKLKSALHALAGMLPQPRSTEKTKHCFGSRWNTAPKNDPGP